MVTFEMDQGMSGINLQTFAASAWERSKFFVFSHSSNFGLQYLPKYSSKSLPIDFRYQGRAIEDMQEVSLTYIIPSCCDSDLKIAVFLTIFKIVFLKFNVHFLQSIVDKISIFPFTAILSF